MFCKVEDSNKNLYILTDKNKQPLITFPSKNTCLIANGKKFLNNPELFISTMKELSRKIEMKKDDEKKTNFDFFLESDFFVDTKIPYTIKDNNSVAIVNISDIDFNIYDIATINKDIVIKTSYINDKQYTEKDIEESYIILFDIDENNKDFNDKMKPYKNLNKGEYPPLNIVSEIMTKMYDYYQKLLNKEEYNNCIISNWTPCNDSTQTRKKTVATKIGKACTPDEDNLPLTQTCSLPPSPSTTESSDNNMYIGIGIFVLFIFVIAFGFYILKKKPNQPNY
jgi:hypothetical protein